MVVACSTDKRVRISTVQQDVFATTLLQQGTKRPRFWIRNDLGYEKT